MSGRRVPVDDVRPVRGIGRVRQDGARGHLDGSAFIVFVTSDFSVTWPPATIFTPAPRVVLAYPSESAYAAPRTDEGVVISAEAVLLVSMSTTPVALILDAPRIWTAVVALETRPSKTVAIRKRSICWASPVRRSPAVPVRVGVGVVEPVGLPLASTGLPSWPTA